MHHSASITNERSTDGGTGLVKNEGVLGGVTSEKTTQIQQQDSTTHTEAETDVAAKGTTIPESTSQDDEKNANEKAVKEVPP